MAARFYDAETKSRLRDKRRLSAFIDALLRQYRPALKHISLSYLFRSDKALIEVNRQFLDHDTYTDIITFDLSETPETLVAEIHISTERVAENAPAFGVSYQTELHRVLFHGALHLAGLRDKTPAQVRAMRQAEDAALREYFATDTPTPEPA